MTTPVGGLVGLLADRPNRGERIGSRYYATDAGVFEWNGAAWIDVDLHETVIHDWAMNGWDAFTPVVMTADGAQAFAPTVANGRGIVTGTQPGSGAMRVAYLLNNSEAKDGELRQVIWGATADWDGGNAQQGALHRVREISPGVWEGIAVWTTVVGGQTYNFLHARAVRFNGVTLFQSGGGSGFGSADDSYIDRAVRVIGHERLFFVNWLNIYTLAEPSRLRHLEAGDLVTVSNIADGTFNETNIAATGPPTNSGTLNVIEPTTLSAVAYTTDNQAAVLAPSGVDVPKRYTPFVLATRVIGGDPSSVTIEAKRWRLGEPEPDWGDARVRRGAVTTNVDVPAVATGPGLSGLWAAHFHDGSGGAWGDVVFKKF